MQYDDLRCHSESLNGIRYEWRHAPARPGKPTLLLLHGFPLGPRSWHRIVPKITAAGLGVLIPTLLGYGDNPPTDLKRYRWRAQAEDMVALLDEAKLESVVAVGHDQGTNLASRLYLHFPQRVRALGLYVQSVLKLICGRLAVPYFPPSSDRDALAPTPAMINGMAKQVVGYETQGYVELLLQDDAASFIRGHSRAFTDVFLARDPLVFKEYACPTGTFKKTLEGGEVFDRAPWFDSQLQLKLDERAKDLSGPLQWYHGLFSPSQPSKQDELDPKPQIDVPTMFIASTEDYGTPIAFSKGQKALIATLREEIIDGGHWQALEQPDRVADIVIDWLSTL